MIYTKYSFLSLSCLFSTLGMLTRHALRSCIGEASSRRYSAAWSNSSAFAWNVKYLDWQSFILELYNSKYKHVSYPAYNSRKLTTKIQKGGNVEVKCLKSDLSRELLIMPTYDSIEGNVMTSTQQNYIFISNILTEHLHLWKMNLPLQFDNYIVLYLIYFADLV